MKEIEKELIKKEEQKVEALKILDGLNEDIFKVHKVLDKLDLEISKLKERIAANKVTPKSWTLYQRHL